MLIYGERTVKFEASRSYTKVRCYKKCDPNAFLADLNNVPWHTTDVFTSVDGKLDCWKSLFNSVIDEHFPLRSVCLRSHSLKWMNDRVIKFMRSRNYFCTKYKHTKCSSDWNKLKLLKKAVVRELRRAKAAYFADVGHTISHNPRKGWSLLNSAVRPKQKSHNKLLVLLSLLLVSLLLVLLILSTLLMIIFQHFLLVYLFLILVLVIFILFQSLLKLFWMV